ncbi:cobyric acid synthase [Chloroflexota bacterium]
MKSKATRARVLMIQGTASSVGKSILVTALCRIIKQDGFSVAPFKAQNMSLNSFVTREGGEIGRAQVVQAEAAGIEPVVDMNPILLKPEADSKSQVVVLGKVMETMAASDYYQYKDKLLKVVADSLNRLRSAYDFVIIEGAGSPAEINLKKQEIVNMRIARLAKAPVLLAGDIDRGGVFAALIGTLHLMEPDEERLVKGFIINKFRGDMSLLKSGLDILESRTGKPVVGVVPYFRDISIAQEDSVYLEERRDSFRAGNLDIAIIKLPHISNYDDFDPLEMEGCRVRYVTSRRQLGNPDLIIIPGSKSTISDLEFLWHSRLAEEIIRQAKDGTPVLGICGGHQMLGKRIEDPHGVESAVDSCEGLGLLNMVNTFDREKVTTQVKARVIADKGILSEAKGRNIEGYEIHMGRCMSQNEESAFHIFQTPEGEAEYTDGAINTAGTILGTYIHGIFNNDSFRKGFLDSLRKYHELPSYSSDYAAEKENQYDKLAELVRRNLDMQRIYRIIEEGTD